MVLESTIICVDNSEWMRNGDFLPSRIQAQQDGVGIICHAKTRQNPENNVGLLTLASLEVLVTLTSDSGKILNKLHHVQPKGKVKLLTGIRIAHLALKHRLGKNHKMRIVAFVGSPVEANEKELTKLAMKLKKEKVNVDIVCLAEDNDTSEKLANFINTLNGKDGTGSHLVTIPPGPSLAEAIRTSPIIQGEDGYTPAGGFGSGFDDIDPNLDPELALALRVSMEEQRMRQESEAREATDASKEESVTPEQQPPASAPAGNTNDDTLLQNALAMSLGGARLDVGGLSEDEQIAMAIQMSMQESQDDSRPTTGASEDVTNSEVPSAMDTDEPDKEGSEEQDYSAVMNDPEFLQHLVSSLPDVDPNSEAVRSALRALTQQNDEEKKEGDKKDSNKK